MSVNEILGDAGIGYSTGGATVEAPGGKKIHAIGVVETANVTNLKHTPPKVGNTAGVQKTVSDLTWFGVSLPVVGPTSYMPLGYDADELTYASGTIILYYR